MAGEKRDRKRLSREKDEKARERRVDNDLFLFP